MFPVRRSVVTSSLLSPSSMSITREDIHCKSKNPLSMRQSVVTGLHTRLRGVASSARQNIFMSWGRLWGLRSCTFSSSEKRDAHLYLSERQKNLLFILISFSPSCPLLALSILSSPLPLFPSPLLPVFPSFLLFLLSSLPLPLFSSLVLCL